MLEKEIIPYVKDYINLIQKSPEYHEIYKWESVNNFKKHWDLSSDDLSQMFENSFPGNNNLWSSNNYYPIAVLKGFADTDREGVVNAFNLLFDESNDLAERISGYKAAMDILLETDNKKRGVANKFHYQDARTIALFLAFNNPQRYFLFKYSVLKSFGEKISLTTPKRGDLVNQILSNQEISTKVKSILVRYPELLEAHNKRLTENSYINDDNNLLVQDFIYAVATYLNDKMKYYLVGAYWDTSSPQDQTQKFIKDGVWINGYESKFASEVNAVQPGSRIAIKSAFVREKTKSVMAVKARGVVRENLLDGQTLLVDWQENFKSFEVDFGGYMNTIKEVTNNNHITSIWQNQTTENRTQETYHMDQPLNKILYGPPGTGKTYHTKELAVRIANPSFNIKDFEDDIAKREAVIKQYDELYNDGQIVFTTFHQSLSYEDFMEGIKPVLSEKNDTAELQYEVGSGIFKMFCKRAISEYYNQDGTNSQNTYHRLNSFDYTWNMLLEEVQNALDRDTYFTLQTLTGKEFEVISISNQGNLNLKPKVENALEYTVSYTRIQKLFEAYPKLFGIKNIDKEFRAIIGGSNSTAYWSVLNFIERNIMNNAQTITPDKGTQFNEHLIKFDNKIVKDNLDKNITPYILIIDEINRGNVSSIFGELITLLEKDKRLGNDEAIEAILPYSKEKFGVPPNLYIIGTMNTADRSVEALDTALRRRFSFEELMPQPDLLKNIQFDGFSLDEVLKVINERIEVLLDRDHTIGHSYFIKIKSNDTKSLASAFKNCIIPLLQEYFYHDYEKIGFILGKSFFEEPKKIVGNIFAPFHSSNIPEVVPAFKLRKIDEDFDIINAVTLLLNIKIDNTIAE